LISGPTIEIQLFRRSLGIAPSRGEWAFMAMLRGLSFGFAGWLMVGHDFGIAFGILCTFAMHISYEFGFGTNIYRAYQRPELHRRLLLPGIVRGAMIGVAGAVSGALTGRPEALLYGIQIGAVVGILNTTVTILSSPVEWWADNLPNASWAAMVPCCF
jgi:hypothetical protein